MGAPMGYGFRYMGDGPVATILRGGFGGVVDCTNAPIRIFDAVYPVTSIRGVSDDDGFCFAGGNMYGISSGAARFRWTNGYFEMATIVRMTNRFFVVPPAPQVISAAGDTITSNASKHVSPDAAYVMTSTPTIPNGTWDGEVMRLRNIAAFNLTLQDEAILAGSNMEFAGGLNVVLAQYECVDVEWQLAKNAWVQVATKQVI